MKLTKENVFVFIEDEAQLEQARELLYRYKQNIFKIWFNIDRGNHLIFDKYDSDWFFVASPLLINEQTKITLTELEQILKDGSTKKD